MADFADEAGTLLPIDRVLIAETAQCPAWYSPGRMSLQPFFSYFGSKHALAKRYSTPRHDTIIEPFAGSAGYSMRHHHKRVILIDRDPVIVAVWRYIVRVSERDVLRLPAPARLTSRVHTRDPGQSRALPL